MSRRMTADFVYRLATPDDHDLVLQFLREHYYKEEPLTVACKPVEQDKYDEEANMSNIAKEYGACVIGMCGDQIVGVLLAGSKERNEEKLLLEEASEIPGTKWGKILHFLAYLERVSNVYEKYNVDKAIHGHVLGVHKDYRGKGIGLRLFEKSIERAKELGYPLYSTDCTSVYSARLCERLGMECVSVNAFKDFRMPGSDEQVLFPPEDHPVVKTFAKKLL